MRRYMTKIDRMIIDKLLKFHSTSQQIHLPLCRMKCEGDRHQGTTTIYFFISFPLFARGKIGMAVILIIVTL